MATRLHGLIGWSGDWDEDGYRSYALTWLVQSNSKYDGPSAVSVTVGLPIVGQTYLLANDRDDFSWCRPGRRIQKHDDRQGDSYWWTVETRFSNRPPDSRQAAQRDPASNGGQGVNSPLLEPPKINITSIKDREQTTHDRFGLAVLTSSHELLKGPQLEFDLSRASVRIEQNVVDAQIDLLAALDNSLNDRPLWGLPRRCVKMSGYGAEPLYYNSFLRYYKRTVTFETDRRTFDRFLPDVGTKALWGDYDATTGVYVTKPINAAGDPPDPENPSHFKLWLGRDGNPTQVALNGAGLPANTITTLDGYSVSIANANTNHPLDDPDWWLPFHGEYGEYDFSQIYGVGDVATKDGATYLAGELVPALAPPPPAAPWVALPSGLISAGNYSSATAYAIGSKVRDTARTGLGYRRVEKYAEANLLVLGIPIIL